MTPQIRPVHDTDGLRKYIDAYWRPGHILARDPLMFAFTYATPWVDRRIFPQGVSVLGLYDGGRMLGFLGAIVTPYPRPQSYWLALWHVLPELKGGGLGGQLLEHMQQIALDADGWIGTFGAGPEALPVYLKRGFCVRAGRRWVFAPEQVHAAARPAPALHSAEFLPDDRWIEYRFRKHPVYSYDVRPGGIFRSEENEWGHVTHAVWLAQNSQADTEQIFRAATARATAGGKRYLMDAWAFDAPGPGWVLAPHDLPSVFHPVQARGNVTYAVGRPFNVTRVHKGDCDQDRPNFADVPAPELAAV